MRRWLAGIALALAGLAAVAEEILPPVPSQHFNDYAQAVSGETAARLDERLQAFERETSNQILVAVFPRLTSESSLEDYTYRVAEFWKIGQADKNNGAVLFAFMEDRALFLQVGYGLEGALPDARSKQIISDVIIPRFRQGDIDGGFEAGVDAILAATRGEYTAPAGGDARPASAAPFVVAAGVFALLVIVLAIHNRRLAAKEGRRWVGNSGGWTSHPSSGGGGGGYSSSGGGFSGGGGHFGGGGAGGRW